MKQPDLIKAVPYLDQMAIETAFIETAKIYKGAALLSEMAKEFVAYTLPATYKSVKISGGMLLYGPPGMLCAAPLEFSWLK